MTSSPTSTRPSPRHRGLAATRRSCAWPTWACCIRVPSPFGAGVRCRGGRPWALGQRFGLVRTHDAGFSPKDALGRAGWAGCSRYAYARRGFSDKGLVFAQLDERCLAAGGGCAYARRGFLASKQPQGSHLPNSIGCAYARRRFSAAPVVPYLFPREAASLPAQPSTGSCSPTLALRRGRDARQPGGTRDVQHRPARWCNGNVVCRCPYR